MTLALQLVGGILVATVGWFEWQISSAVSYLVPGWIDILFGAMLSMYPAILKWRPMRNPARPDSVLGAPVVGMRLALRWLVMQLARNPWLLIGTPMYLLFTIWGEQNIPTVVPQMPIQEPIILFGAAAAFFLVAALAELTHHG